MKTPVVYPSCPRPLVNGSVDNNSQQYKKDKEQSEPSIKVRCERVVGLRQLRSHDSSTDGKLGNWCRYVWKRRTCVSRLAQFNTA
ncbi:hypothetical protein T4A_949 [Trichinella pseudospiralis]|uniref:Uncharacterized protein n=1 Tax=Trichinella pseudospiralis TaxID=6337 RepID=A0A0V1EZG9_TRIPS|nr:hypothetical protein T4A_949 [Trichinella pseudospiralis]